MADTIKALLENLEALIKKKREYDQGNYKGFGPKAPSGVNTPLKSRDSKAPLLLAKQKRWFLTIHNVFIESLSLKNLIVGLISCCSRIVH